MDFAKIREARLQTARQYSQSDKEKGGLNPQKIPPPNNGLTDVNTFHKTSSAT